jgi:hypothetical protein
MFALEKPTRPRWLWISASCLQIAYMCPEKKNPAIYSIAGFQYLLGVADGARTHDNRNHNLTQQSSIHAGFRGVHGYKNKFQTRMFKGLARSYNHGFKSPLPARGLRLYPLSHNG